MSAKNASPTRPYGQLDATQAALHLPPTNAGPVTILFDHRTGLAYTDPRDVLRPMGPEKVRWSIGLAGAQSEMRTRQLPAMTSQSRPTRLSPRVEARTVLMQGINEVARRARHQGALRSLQLRDLAFAVLSGLFVLEAAYVYKIFF